LKRGVLAPHVLPRASPCEARVRRAGAWGRLGGEKVDHVHDRDG
jgi:hypothetical protein